MLRMSVQWLSSGDVDVTMTVVVRHVWSMYCLHAPATLPHQHHLAPPPLVMPLDPLATDPRFCVVIADATRFALCLIWKLQHIGSEWAIYCDGGISLTWHSRHAHFLA